MKLIKNLFKKRYKCCETCINLTPIGEGDHVCTEGKKPKMPLCEYEPTNEYMWCRGKKYMER